MALNPHSSAYLGPGYHPVQQLVLSDENLLFELTLSGARTPPQTLNITNSGTKRVYIRKVVLVYGADDFTLINPGDWPSHLDPTEQFNVVVDFDARFDGQALGLLEIYTNEDRLPYVIGLYSRTQREITFADQYSDLVAQIAAEANIRATADISQNNARNTLDTTLRALVASTNLTEKNARISADTALGLRIDDVISRLGAGSITVIDTDARSLISIESGARITADASEAFYRLLLQTEFETAISEANAAITDEYIGRTTAFDALAQRTTTLEATYQTSGDVTSIASALISIEHTAWTSALAAEASTRTTLIANVTSYVDTKVGLEAVTRSAVVMSEQAARIAGDVSLASSVTTLTTRTSATRGITPNGTFEAVNAGWTSSGMTFIDDGQGHYLPTSAVGAYADVGSTRRVPVDTRRAYQLNVDYTNFINPNQVYFGIQCFDINGTYLGNVYDTIDSGNFTLGSRIVSQIFSGEFGTTSVPSFLIGNKFLKNTASITLLALINYPGSVIGGVPVADSYGKIKYFWLDDITNAYSVDARVTEEIFARTTAEGAIAGQITSLQADYTSARADLDDIISATGDNAAEIVSAHARIDTEQIVRANAVLAEASRVDAIIASLEIGDGLTEAEVDAKILVETNARVSADAAEASRIDAIIANYTTTSGMNSAISTAVSAEVTNRNSAIATAVAAEASRIDSIVANYSTTGSMNSAISAAVSTEASARATADSAIASTVTTVSSNLGTLSSTVSSQATAIAGLGAKAGVTLDVNGYMTGWALNNNGDYGDFIVRADLFKVVEPGNTERSIFEVTSTYVKFLGKLQVDGLQTGTLNADINVGTGRIIYDNGSVMKVTGTGFGTSNQFIEWYGPSMDIDDCSEATAIQYLKTNGSAYFGGSIAAGIIKNSVQTTNTSSTASVDMGPASSNGNPRTVVLSYSFGSLYEMNTGANGAASSGSISATVELYLFGSLIGTLNATGSWTRTAYGGPGSNATYTEEMDGSITVSDLSGGISTEYAAAITARVLGPTPTLGIVASGVNQTIAILSLEP